MLDFLLGGYKKLTFYYENHHVLLARWSLYKYKYLWGWRTRVKIQISKRKFHKLFTYFCYYLWFLFHFLVLFIDPTVLFQLHLTLFTILSTQNFQFQLNKLFPNRRLTTKRIMVNWNLLINYFNYCKVLNCWLYCCVKIKCCMSSILF